MSFIFTAIQGGLSNYVEQKTNTVAFSAPDRNGQKETSAKPEKKVIPFTQQKSDIYVDDKSDTIYIPQKKFEQHLNINFRNTNSDNTEQHKMFEQNYEQEQDGDKIIGQYHDTYILIDNGDGLEIVDQHIAQERYNYEKLQENKEIISQILFISDVITVSASEAEILKENISKFEKFGYGIEFTSDTELIFRKIPQILSKVSPKEILADILQNIEGNIDNLEENILKTTACKSSVKANTPLSIWQMQDIIKKWRTTKMPYTCPHGRPISHIIPHKELAAFFERAK